MAVNAMFTFPGSVQTVMNFCIPFANTELHSQAVPGSGTGDGVFCKRPDFLSKSEQDFLLMHDFILLFNCCPHVTVF